LQNNVYVHIRDDDVHRSAVLGYARGRPASYSKGPL